MTITMTVLTIISIVLILAWLVLFIKEFILDTIIDKINEINFKIADKLGKIEEVTYEEYIEMWKNF